MYDSKNTFSIPNDQPITLQNIVSFGCKFLKNHNIENAQNELQWFICDLYKFDKIELFKNLNLIVTNNNYQTLNQFIIQRSKRIPFQYLMKKASFYGRDFIVDKNVLIPRPETEMIIDLIKNQAVKDLLDMGTGSGAIAITAKIEKIAQNIDAIDIDHKALDIAKKNCQKFNIDTINLIKMDILNTLPEKKYNIVISNPPYVSMQNFKNLEMEIMHEPMHAITDLNNGLTFYKRYSQILKKILKPNGFAIFELSHCFDKNDMESIFVNFQNIKFYADLNNDIRFIKVMND